MPMGFQNAPGILQHRVMSALHKYIGVFCHVYLDNIVVWSDNLDEHIKHCCLLLRALTNAKLYCNKKKTKLFCFKIIFLGHTISQDGIEADERKAGNLRIGLFLPLQRRSGCS